MLEESSELVIGRVGEPLRYITRVSVSFLVPTGDYRWTTELLVLSTEEGRKDRQRGKPTDVPHFGPLWRFCSRKPLSDRIRGQKTTPVGTHPVSVCNTDSNDLRLLELWSWRGENGKYIILGTLVGDRGVGSYKGR